MKLFLLLILAVSFVYTNTIPAGKCPGTRPSLLKCLKQMIDLNKDGKITPSELETMFQKHNKQLSMYLPHYGVEFIMKACDVNKDGILDMSDWNNINGCLSSTDNSYVKNYVCRLCWLSGYNE